MTVIILQRILRKYKKISVFTLEHR